ncbi:MAG: chemotaxis protein CheB [Candidatus Riflebacteria bacterium]|nr:chemotaxis protein CheB [Candidatus Riflebacteria bacterium]
MASLVVIGCSLGGLDALRVLLAAMPAEFPWPIAIVQHRGKNDDRLLVPLLQEVCALPVGEVEDKQPIALGHIFVAPADYHLLVEPAGFALSIDPPVSYSRPSIDVLFESAAASRRTGAVGVILTGTGEDGAAGAAAIKRRGGLVLVQDPSTATAGAMPGAAIAAAPVDRVLQLEAIAPALAELAREGRLPEALRDDPGPK